MVTFSTSRRNSSPLEDLTRVPEISTKWSVHGAARNSSVGGETVIADEKSSAAACSDERNSHIFERRARNPRTLIGCGLGISSGRARIIRRAMLTV